MPGQIKLTINFQNIKICFNLIFFKVVPHSSKMTNNVDANHKEANKEKEKKHDSGN